MSDPTPHRHGVMSRAQRAAQRALRKGQLPPLAECEACGLSGATTGLKRPIVGHHPDYSQPLWVIPLCHSCHRRVHSGRIPEPRTGRVYPRWTKDGRELPPFTREEVLDAPLCRGPRRVAAPNREAKRAARLATQQEHANVR